MNVNKLTMFFFTKFQNLIIVTYKVCHWFRLTSLENYFWVNFDQFWIDCRFFWGCWSSSENCLEP